MSNYWEDSVAVVDSAVLPHSKKVLDLIWVQLKIEFVKPFKVRGLQNENLSLTVIDLFPFCRPWNTQQLFGKAGALSRQQSEGSRTEDGNI